MSLFFVNKPNHDGDLNKNLIEAHCCQPLVATGFSNPPSVLITDYEGEVLAVVTNPNKELNVASLAWHPVHQVLMIGWSSGKMNLWATASPESLGIGSGATASLALVAKAATTSDVEGAVREHNAGTIVASTWTTNGHYLLTSSAQKCVVLWGLERTVADKAAAVVQVLKPLWSVNTEQPITRVFHVPGRIEDQQDAATPSVAAVDAAAAAAAKADGKDDDVNFILSDGSPKVWSLNDEQKMEAVVTQTERILEVLYDKKERILVLLNAKFLLDAFVISDDITASVLSHQKLTLPPATTTPENSTITMVWAAPAVVAVACGDDRLRAFDVRHDDAFMIPLPFEGTHVTNIASDLSKNMLTIGNAEGTLVVFQKSSESSAAGGRRISLTGNALPVVRDPALGWEAVATHNMATHIDRIVCTPLGDMITCVEGKKLHVLHETVRKRDWDGVAAATQISSDMVVVESVTGCQCLLHSNTKIRGLSISFPMIVLWDGSQLSIYTINEATSEFSLTRSVPTSSPVFSAHPDGLFYVKDDRIIYSTWQLEPLGQLAFTEAEGVPMLLDVMCDFVVAVSTKNVLRLAKVSSRDMRPLGPSRPLNLSDATLLYVPTSGNSQEVEQVRVDVTEPVTVVAARVNAQGRRVALMTKVGALGKSDSRIWVFDSDTDKAYCYDFGPRCEIPDAVYWNTPEPNANSIGELEYLLLACETHEVRADRLTGKGPGEEGGDSGAGGAAHKGRQPVHHEDLPGALPDMQNFAETSEARRASIGATNFLVNRSHNLVTLFATHKGLVLHNSVSLKEYQICLVGLTIPDFLLASIKINGDPTNAEDYVIEQKRLRDFDGLKSDKDVVVREALLKFSYYATIGNMDEAYRCIKTIKNPAAWHGLARMCVSNGRLDVAAVCLATMQDGVAARLLRESKEEYPYDKNVQLATLACSLKMMDETEHLLKLSHRYDLITDVYLACGKFEQAQRHSQRFDRIRIRPVAYKYAQFMESLQNMDAAIMWYFNARCAGTDVPRVFFQTNRLHELRELMLSGQNQEQNQENAAPPASFEDPQSTFASLFPHSKDLLQWWAQYSERRRNMQEALRFYESCDDTYNMVRILCSVKPPKLENAVELVQEEIDDAKAKYDQYQSLAAAPGEHTNTFSEPERVGAAYFVGKCYEVASDVETALKYYRYAGAYRSGVRVARKAERDADIVALALASKDERLILDMAIYLEKKGSFDKAVELYRNVNATQLALDVCIRGGLYDTLHEISTNLANAKTDPEVFMNMANHFQSIGQYQKTVEMLVFAKKYDDALRMCEERNVILTDEMAEAMTGENSSNNALPADERIILLKRVAHTAKDQGSWSLACKKYTQAGERVKALKMLMRGGEVEKVIFFTNHSRSTEIYTLAANFLQSQNWSTDPNVYKSIIQFYTKAKAFDSLFSFYESCAQFRIDEDRDYKQALGCIEDCVRAMDKANANKQNVNMNNVASLKEKGKIIASVVKAQQIYDSMDPQRRGTDEEKKKSDEVVAICSDLVKRSRPNHDDHVLVEQSIRIGDVFALLVRFYMEKLDEPKNALKVLESMPKHGIEPQYFVEVDYMEKVCKANDKRLRDVVTISSAAGLSPSEGRRRSSAIAHSTVLDEEMK